MSWKISLAVGLALMGAGEVTPTPDGMWLQWGALGILGVAVIKLFAELAAQRSDAKSEREAHTNIITELCNRWDGWEKTRHDDHEKLTRTLTDLQTNCAAKGK